MKHFSSKAILFCFLFGTISLIAQTNSLTLQGVIDFTVPSGGSDGKAIHLKATADIADLSVFGIGVANNGGGTDGLEYSLDSVSATSGDDILIVRSEEAMSAYFADCYSEFEIVLVGSSEIAQNGDDAIELYESETLIETFGDPNVDGTGEAWEYMDSWAYKVGGVWTFGEVNCTDGSLTSADSNCPYPICSSVEPTPDVTGCTDATANNFDAAANVDDGSCTYDLVELTYALSLQGVMDLYASGAYSGTDGKAIHLVANQDIADLSAFSLSVANNGGGSDGPEYTLSGSANAGDDILVYRVGSADNSSVFFSEYFGACFSEFEITIAAGSSFPDGNGDDPVELFEGDTVIDFYGDVNGSAMSGDPYEDSWVYRNDDGSWNEPGEDADEDDGTYSVYTSGAPYPLCSVAVEGCTDSTAYNYNPLATSDDGSCVPVVEGCTWEGADNYNPDANTNDGSCFTTSLGCTDSLALNFDSGANTDDGSCLFDNSSLTNALSLQGILDLSLDSSDGKAIHLKATSDIADLSVFGIGVANNGGGTDGMEYTLDSVSASAGDDILIARSPDSISAYFADCYSEFEIVLVASSAISQNGDDAIELYEQGVIVETFGDPDVDGSGETWEYTDSWAFKVNDEWTYGGANCTDGSTIFSEASCPYPICESVPVSGCMDPDAFNYNPNATVENGTCINVIFGCTLQGADNYNPLANTNDGTCEFQQVALSLQGVMDLYGSVPSGDPDSIGYSGTDGKAIHLVANEDIADLSIYSLSVANNGGGSDGPEYSLSGSANAGDDILVYRVGSGDNSVNFFSDYFGDCFSEFEITIATGTTFPDGNGDDPVELFAGDTVVIDFYGDVNGSAMSGDPYEDSWAYRNADGSWLEAGEDADENDSTYSVFTSGAPYPLCGVPLPVGCDAPADWNVIVTGSNHTIVIPSESIVSLADGSVLDHANVGVFYTNNNGDLACAGSAEVTPGETVQIAAMGDDTTTPEVDGLVSGSDLVWMIADCYGNVFAANATYSAGPEVFTINGITNVSAITEAPAGPSEQELSFVTGWSMFSTYMIPADLDLVNLLSPIVDKVIIAKDYLGAAYLPEWNFNGIGDLTLGQGYQIKTTETSGVTVTGDYAVPQDNPINLSAGWNMIGYLRVDGAPADAVLADINATGNLIIAKDYLGAAYLPEWNFNGIGDLNPGQAYQVKIFNADVLQYLSNDGSYRMSAIEVTENNVSYFAKLAPTDNNMTVVIEDAAWDTLPIEGSEIAAFDKNGNIVGSAIYSSPLTVVTVWGDDATTVSKDGMLVAESILFKVWNTNEVSDFTVTKWIEGSSSYQVDGISIASTIETNNVITELNASERVLVKVINVLGQEVNLDDEPFKGTVLFNVYDDGSVIRFVE